MTDMTNAKRQAREVNEVAMLLSSVEADIRKVAPQQSKLSNSADMIRAKELLSNGVTTAHDDTCKALDKAVSDARALMTRLEKSVEERKRELTEGGQRIALQIEQAMTVLTSTVEWVERQTPSLRHPEGTHTDE